MQRLFPLLLSVDLGAMQGSLNKMAPASRQWRQAADWARELAQLVDTMQTWLARRLSCALPFQKVFCLFDPAKEFHTKLTLVCTSSLMQTHACQPLFWILHIFSRNTRNLAVHAVQSSEHQHVMYTMCLWPGLCVYAPCDIVQCMPSNRLLDIVVQDNST